MASEKIVNIADLDDDNVAFLFQYKDYLLGDKKGKWICVFCDDGGQVIPTARYLNKNDAIDYVSIFEESL